MIKSYDLCYVGAGPSTMFSVLKLIEEGYRGNILILEKGKSLKNRSRSEVIEGVFGAGTYSDSKISSSIDVGGNIPGLTEEQLKKYEDYLLLEINKFKPDSMDNFNWDKTKSFNTDPSSLVWDVHKTCHVGTDNGFIIYSNIENYIESQPNVTLLTETEVTEVINLSDGSFQVAVSHNKGKSIYRSSKVIIATGQKGTLPISIIKNNNLSSRPRALQLGVRVEDQINSQYEKIIKSNYDFKFVSSFNYGNGIKGRVRTFCCNSGNAHTCAEVTPMGFTCFNGHALRAPDPTNHTVNYGIMCELDGMPEYNSQSNQIEMMKKVNNLPTWKEDNLDGFGNPSPKRNLLEGFEHLRGIYPDIIINELTKFVSELNRVVNLNKAKYLYPEIKLSGEIPDLNPSFETTKKNLYMIGDCSYSRGIMKAVTCGVIFAEHILEEQNK